MTQATLINSPFITGDAAHVLERAAVIITEEGYRLEHVAADRWLSKLKVQIANGEAFMTQSDSNGKQSFRDCVEAYFNCQRITGAANWRIFWTYDTHLTAEKHARGCAGSNEWHSLGSCTKAEAVAAFETEFPTANIMVIEPHFPVWEARKKAEADQREEVKARALYVKLKARFEPASIESKEGSDR